MPVVSVDDTAHADPLADALVAGGLPCAEITLRTEAGLAAIRSLARRGDLLVGAGTVHSVDQAARVAEAGAAFVVSPGLNPKTVRWCIDHAVPVIPGVATPTDLEAALEFGLEVVKFFPAEALGGVAMLRALGGPFAGVRFVPTGGITADNVGSYLSLPNVLAVGGSWMVQSQRIAAGRFDEIRRAVSEAVQTAGGT